MELGPQRWAREHVVPKLRGRKLDAVFIAYPGGQEEDESDLRLDMIDQCAKHRDPRVQAMGDYAAWADAANEIGRRLQCKVGFYLGTTEGGPKSVQGDMTRWSVEETCFTINAAWSGFVDFVVIDTLAARPLGHLDWLAAHMISAGKMEVGAEPRAVRERPLLPGMHVCIWSKWLEHNASEGDDQHLSRAEMEANKASVIVLDLHGEISPEMVMQMRVNGIGICVGVDRVPVVAEVGGVGAG